MLSFPFFFLIIFSQLNLNQLLVQIISLPGRKYWTVCLSAVTTVCNHLNSDLIFIIESACCFRMSSYGSWLVFREVDTAPWNVAVVGADDDGSARPQATLYPVIAPFVQWLDPFNDFRFVKTKYQIILLLTLTTNGT